MKDIETARSVVFDSLKNYPKHWFIGNFEPSLYKTKDFEVAIFQFKAGTRSDLHMHLKCIEINVVISGECLVSCSGIKTRLKDGEVFAFPRGVKTDVTYVKDTTLLCIKTPSIPGDKVWDKEKEDDEG